jgi:hypothetical protein
MKKCSKCAKVKQTSEFYPDKGHRDGLTSACRVCMRVQARTWQETHPERARELKRRHKAKRRAAAQRRQSK